MQRPAAVLTTATGAPLAIEATVRESESAPSRLKVGFAVRADEGIGIRHPVTGETIPQEKPQEGMGAPLCAEFRLEMN